MATASFANEGYDGIGLMPSAPAELLLHETPRPNSAYFSRSGIPQLEGLTTEPCSEHKSLRTLEPSDDVTDRRGKGDEKSSLLMRADDFLQSSTLTSKESGRFQINTGVASAQSNPTPSGYNSANELYGELVVYGTTPSRFPGGNSARRRSKLQLRRRAKANGVVPHKEYYSSNTPEADAASLGSTSSHVVCYSLSRSRAYVVEYTDCSNYDMFQIGRSTESNIDMVLIDTVPGASKLEDCTRSESTISRYACRIMVSRNESASKPRIYAAGFDHNRSIQLGEKALKWQISKNSPRETTTTTNNNNSTKSNESEGNFPTSSQHDGLTTNGVLILNPDEKGSYANSTWREVSICGGIYTMRENKNKTIVYKVPNETNELRDGCLIDLCGTTLLWRSAEHVHSILDEVEFVEKVQKSINSRRPQCPISFNTLYLPKTKAPPLLSQGKGNERGSSDEHSSADKRNNNVSHRHSRTPLPDMKHSQAETLSRDPSFNSNHRPYACFPCGHVYGYFDAPSTSISSSPSSPNGPPILEGVALTSSSSRECPLCRHASVLVALSLGDEPAFHMDSDEPTYAFNPCGHTCSLATAKHWSSVLIPSSNGGKRMCPFCAVTLEDRGYIALIFQDRFI